ncbi:hypothetical protein GMRT_10032 [Giardia muris]|uniref:Uncharacterized protein n=1 Tax=Giardia muris TaxID=5742 RepID=A0A4Z1SQT2_GIAMU|nr:hypothetical protein GMRT_10032 [Giardia muris]|eukprot:TNJ28050.1 hypothetical protein GMRT_10032 [Giardia muris]
MQELYSQLRETRRDVERQLSAIERQVDAVTSILSPPLILLGEKPQHQLPALAQRLQEVEDRVATFLRSKKAQKNGTSTPDQAKLLHFNHTLEETRGLYMKGVSKGKELRRVSQLDSIIPDVLGPSSPLTPEAAGQSVEGVIDEISACASQLQRGTDPFIQHGLVHEGFLTQTLRDVALEVGGCRSLRGRLLINEQDWKALLPFLSTEVVKMNTLCYQTLLQTLTHLTSEYVTNGDDPQLLLHTIRLAEDLLDTNLWLTRRAST